MGGRHRCEDEHGHGHDHNHDSAETGIEYSLYQKIDIQRVECLNEAEDNSGKLVFKPWEDRLDLEKVFIFIYVYLTRTITFEQFQALTNKNRFTNSDVYMLGSI